MSGELFWMGGRLATQVLEISHDPASLEEDGFWAVQVDYEGQWTLIRFQDVVERSFPESNESFPGDLAEWDSTLSREAYIDYVSALRASVASGDVYQVNACRILSRKHEGKLDAIFGKILKDNPAPYAAYFLGDEKEIASASPELFLSISTLEDGIHVKSSPIKGTSTQPSFGEKDQSENIMIVDLIRNDLSRVCEKGSVDVTRLLGVEPHPGLFHLVSDVEGRLREDISWQEISQAVLPAGSISGAPKSSAVKLITSNEGRRGPYCGLLGWVERRGERLEGELSVAIRIFWKENGRLRFGTGAGITWGSDPSGEWEETQLKASRLISIADGKLVS